jgi:hypothetical protein
MSWWNQKIKAETIAISAIAAAETFHMGSACMPSFFTAKNWVLDGTEAQIDTRIANWRTGYRPAVAIGLGLSAALTGLTKSLLPLAFGGVASVVMLKMYETALPTEKQMRLAEWPRFLLTGQPAPSMLLAVAAPIKAEYALTMGL